MKDAGDIWASIAPASSRGQGHRLTGACSLPATDNTGEHVVFAPTGKPGRKLPLCTKPKLCSLGGRLASTGLPRGIYTWMDPGSCMLRPEGTKFPAQFVGGPVTSSTAAGCDWGKTRRKGRVTVENSDCSNTTLPTFCSGPLQQSPLGTAPSPVRCTFISTTENVNGL